MSKDKSVSKGSKRKLLDQEEGTKRKSKKHRKDAEPEGKTQPASGLAGLTKASSFDPTLANLFAVNGNVEINSSLISKSHTKSNLAKRGTAHSGDDSSGDEDNVPLKHETLEEHEDDSSDNEAGSNDEQDDETLSSISDAPSDLDDAEIEPESDDIEPEASSQKRRRKQKDDFEDLESSYLDKVSREADKLLSKDKAAAGDGAAKRSDAAEQNSDSEEDQDAISPDDQGDDSSEAGSDSALPPPPQHECLTAQDNAFEQSQRTVFLGNVALDAISSKSALKTLKAHLTSFFPLLKSTTDQTPALASIRFRSTPFATAIPKRASYARKEVMDATAHSTNAYAVYSTPALARSAAQHLNGTTVLDRHLRVDEVAHPSQVDHRRCVFIGNLGFVDDESYVDKANEEDGRSKRKGNKTPGDVEEGLWRTFSKCGKVESVRVIRDSKTRVGKGVAYVQFSEENGVEEALAWDGKRDPPLLPRKMRVTRAKAVKRNKARRPEEREPARGRGGYVPKLTNQERSQVGRAERLLGKSGAKGLMGRGGFGAGQRGRGGFGAQRGRGGFAGRGRDVSQGRGGFGDRSGPADTIKAPESFVFEGQRATSGGDAGVKMKKGPGKKAKPTKNSGKRAAAWKAKKATKEAS